MPQPIEASRPPAHREEIDCWVLDTPGQLSQLRASVQRALTGEERSAVVELSQVPDKMVLVASELATNALRHGVPPTRVSLSRVDDEFVLDVADHDVSRPPVIADDRAPGDGGLGLQIAQRISLEVGWYMEDTTKHVWATFPAEAPDPR